MNYQSATAVLMVRPFSFGFDEQTAKTNVFQHHMRLKSSQVTQKALEEFEDAIRALQESDIDLLVFDDMSHVSKPNAVFVNNWLSTWPDGAVYLYPMATESRRPERNPQILEKLKERFVVGPVVDISSHERRNKYLESTGVMIFDHLSKHVYASLSSRCDEELLRQHTSDIGYQPIVFRAFDRHGMSIYHTNVVLGIQTSTAIVCSEAITDETERDNVLKALTDSGRTIVEISQKQIEKFCANVLEVRNRKGERFLVLSQTAMDNLTPMQQQLLTADKSLVPLRIPTIETIGGGSARCMMAEIFLPQKDQNPEKR
jgi:hypothetical protein